MPACNCKIGPAIPAGAAGPSGGADGLPSVVLDVGSLAPQYAGCEVECFVCAGTEGILLANVCSCRNMIHLECQRKLVSRVPSHETECAICKEPYRNSRPRVTSWVLDGLLLYLPKVVIVASLGCVFYFACVMDGRSTRTGYEGSSWHYNSGYGDYDSSDADTSDDSPIDSPSTNSSSWFGYYVGPSTSPYYRYYDRDYTNGRDDGYPDDQLQDYALIALLPVPLFMTMVVQLRLLLAGPKVDIVADESTGIVIIQGDEKTQQIDDSSRSVAARLTGHYAAATARVDASIKSWGESQRAGVSWATSFFASPAPTALV